MGERRLEQEVRELLADSVTPGVFKRVVGIVERLEQNAARQDQPVIARFTIDLRIPLREVEEYAEAISADWGLEEILVKPPTVEVLE